MALSAADFQSGFASAAQVGALKAANKRLRRLAMPLRGAVFGGWITASGARPELRAGVRCGCEGD